MNKKQIVLLTAIAIITACKDKKGTWDGTDYYTGKDTVINKQTYRHSSMGYYYLINGNNVSKYYPNSGKVETVSASNHANSFSRSNGFNSQSNVSSGGFGSTGKSSFHSSGS